MQGIKKRILYAVLAYTTVILAGVTVVGMYILTDNGFQCYWYKYLGIYCPTCGGTRMVVKLLHFDILGAIQMNAAIMGLSPLLGYIVIWQTYYYIRYGKEIKNLDKLMIFIMIVFVIFAFLRNTETFSFLAPH